MIIHDIALSFAPFNKIVLIKMLHRFKSAERIFSLSHCELTADNGLSDRDAERFLQCRSRCLEKAEKEFALATDLCVTAIAYTSDDYPALLRECCDAPVVVYVMGNKNLVVGDNKWLSIVGTRRCSQSSASITMQMIDDIADRQKDTVIVTGLSYGVETFACRQALKRGVRVVSVLVTSFSGMDNNKELASEILSKNGTLISEYAPSLGFLIKNYEECNRIIAGLSHATILVEAGADSNTLKTAYFASGYDRIVFAFPGGARDVDFVGCNKLIKSGVAEMITEFSDIENSLEMERCLNPIDIFEPKLPSIAKKIYDCLKDGKRHSDEYIMEQSGLSIAEFNSEIIYLTTINDLVEEFSGRMYMKKRQ